MKRLTWLSYCVLALGFSLAAQGDATGVTFLKPTSLVGATNIDWMVLARAERTARTGGQVEFVWPADQSYTHLRRALWLAALHGITRQTCTNADIRRVMASELKAAKKRLGTPLAVEIAVRDVAGAERLLPALVHAQTAVRLIGEREDCDLQTILRCKGAEVTGERTGVAFTSQSMAADFVQACHTDLELVFESDGRVAQNVFVRRFRDGSATVVNLTDGERRDLVYRQKYRRQTFDIPPAGVVHLDGDDTPRLTRNCGKKFLATLWKVSFEGSETPRLIGMEQLPLAVKETYFGRITYATTVMVPPGAESLFLRLDTAGEETSVRLGGRELGTRAWEPFEWTIPMDYHGKSVPLRITVAKRSLNGFIQGDPAWHRP